MRELAADVVVVGAGPAGSAVATLLAESGHEVLAVDRARFPREKVCGDGLAPRSVAMLRRLGLEERLQERGYRPLRRYRIFSSWGDSVIAELPTWGKGPDYLYVVPRFELDQLLVDRAREAGARVEEGVRVLRPVDGAGSNVLSARTDEGEQVRLRGRVVVAADGSRGSFSRTVMPSERLSPYAVAMRVYMEGVSGLDDALHFFVDPDLLPGYGWIFPGGRPGQPANVGLGIQARALRRRPERLAQIFDRFLGPDSMAWPYLADARPVGPAAPFPLLLDFPRGRRRLGTTLFAGDAGNLIDPLSGEGMAYALESAGAVADAVGTALQSGRLSDLARYDAKIWRGLSMEFLGAYLVRQVLVRPAGNGLVVRLLQRDDGLARGGMGVLSNSVPATWLLRPDVLGACLQATAAGLYRARLSPRRWFEGVVLNQRRAVSTSQTIASAPVVATAKARMAGSSCGVGPRGW